jgi:PAS domain S-box-containing protein/diguanylate cyclase (GGDEF)-like protein
MGAAADVATGMTQPRSAPDLSGSPHEIRIAADGASMAVSGGVCAQYGARSGDAAKRAEMSAQDLLELVGRVGSRAGNTATVRELLEFVVAEVAQSAGFSVGHAYRLDGGAVVSDGGCWWVSEQHDGDLGAFRALSDRATSVAGVGLPGRVLAAAEPAWIPDFSAAEGDITRRGAALKAGLRSAFAFPVVVGRRVVAVLEFFADAPTAADPKLSQASAIVGQTVGQVFERIEAYQDQWDLQTHAQSILDNAGDAFVAIDDDGIVIGWNREAERLFGYQAAEAVGRYMPELIMPPEYRTDHDAGIQRYKKNGYGRVAGQYVELEALRKNGDRFPIEMAFWGLHQQGGWQFYSFARDITERKAREAELTYRAVHDEATGLPNRRAALEHIDRALARRARVGGEIAVLLMDLDWCRVTRDWVGQEAADARLGHAAHRVRAAVGADGWVARVADDEFVIVHENATGTDDAVTIAERVQGAFAEPFHLKDDQVMLGASIGVVLTSSSPAATVAARRDGTRVAVPGETAADLLRDASAGVSVERASLRGAVKVFDSGVRSVLRDKLTTEHDLAAAIENGELKLHYQPVVDFARGNIVGVEALVRWQHPRRGLLSPAAFIDVAEESGLIVPLGSWVIREASRQAAKWRSIGPQGLSVAVNLSARQFTQSGLVSDIVSAVHDAALDSAYPAMVFEVTESMLMHDPAAAAAILADLKAPRGGVALDDVGTGYSSLAYLKSFAVNVVKIDRSFITDIASDERDRAIVAAVTGLGHALGLRVLAEGIETEAQRDCVAELGCDLAQGFHFGRPVPAAEITALIG